MDEGVEAIPDQYYVQRINDLNEEGKMDIGSIRSSARQFIGLLRPLPGSPAC